MKTILITAYAVNPFKGSEDGTGWNITRQIATNFKVVLITRVNNIPHLVRYFKENDAPELANISFYGFDLPAPVLKVKKKLGSKAHVPYYYLWQSRIIKFIRSQHFKFDASMCLNFHSDSHPHFLWKLDKPCLWGPIGHHPKVPKEFIWKPYGAKAFITDRIFSYIKWGMRKLNPAFRKSISQTSAIFVINSSIAEVINAPNSKVHLLPAVASNTPAEKTSQSTEKFTVLSAGRFHFIKGFDITIRSFSAFYKQLNPTQQSNVELTLVGSGIEEIRLKQLAHELDINHAINWISWIPHNEMMTLYRKSDLFLFPSHEGAGMVVPEAMSFGLPVLTFDNKGPGELMGIDELKVSYESYQSSLDAFARKLIHLYNHPKALKQYGEILIQRHQRHFTWQQKGTIINQELTRIIHTTSI